MLLRKRFVVAWNAELRSRCFSVKLLLTYWVITIPVLHIWGMILLVLWDGPKSPSLVFQGGRDAHPTRIIP
ncbi:MAG: hypothetical protein V7K40_03445 [Nostoc sp.]|uniref:hypothetical protein n=1 Tax=Nostoc sp. TaxID=1180 RepID=UPI002FF705B5